MMRLVRRRFDARHGQRRRAILQGITQLDWASIEPAIFGILFTRSLDVHALPVIAPADITQAGGDYCFAACHHEETFEPCANCHDEGGGE